MTIFHPRWGKFMERLEGVEGCNFHDNSDGNMTWRCAHNHDLATKILADMGGFDAKASIESFEDNGGYCDCEIVLNMG